MNLDLAKAKPTIQELLHDLRVERDLLRQAIECTTASLDTPTPSPGWCVRDQVAHLAYFDRAAALAVAAPSAFDRLKSEALADVEVYEARTLAGAAAGKSALLTDWDEAFEAFASAVESAEPRRVPWYGPDMSLASMISARLMETWAHGHDVVTALAVDRPATDALRHIVVLAYRARKYGYAVRGLPAPQTDTRLLVTSPSGDQWCLGDPAAELVSGPAEQFCLVLTRRRHIDDTDLQCFGEAARSWMTIGQAYAGPPGPGPQRLHTPARQGALR